MDIPEKGKKYNCFDDGTKATRNSYRDMEWWETYGEPGLPYELNETVHMKFGTIKGEKIKHHPNKHIPNKEEAKMLRKLMSQTGMSEQELRKHKKYRKMLSGAQKKPQQPKSNNKTRKAIINKKILKPIRKNVTKELKLPKEHPKVIEEVNRRLRSWDRLVYVDSFLMINPAQNIMYYGEV